MLLEFNDYNFDNHLSSGLTVIDFWSSWCPPCIKLNPVIKRIAEVNTDVAIGKCNIQENSDLPRRYGVNAIPTILFFKDGKLAKKVMGFQTEQQLQFIINGLK